MLLSSERETVYRPEGEGSMSLEAWLWVPGYPSHPCALCHTMAPFPNLCCSQGLWMHFSTHELSLTLTLCQGMRDQKDAFMNHVKLIWSRSHLKACKMAPSRLFELFLWPNRWLKSSFRQGIEEGSIFRTLFPGSLTQFQSVRPRIQIQFSFKKGIQMQTHICRCTWTY